MKVFSIPVPLVPTRSFAELAQIPEYHNWVGISWINWPLTKVGDTVAASPVPEDSTFLYICIGLAFYFLWKRYRQ